MEASLKMCQVILVVKRVLPLILEFLTSNRACLWGYMPFEFLSGSTVLRPDIKAEVITYFMSISYVFSLCSFSSKKQKEPQDFLSTIRINALTFLALWRLKVLTGNRGCFFDMRVLKYMLLTAKGLAEPRRMILGPNFKVLHDFKAKTIP